jgi:uncharacterized protein YhfF
VSADTMDEDLPPRAAHFGLPGPQRDGLVAAIMEGRKTATSSLLAEYQAPPGTPLPEPADRSAVLDSAGRAVAVIEVTEVRIVPFAQVDLEFAVAEGEGFRTVTDWRAAHRAFWESAEMRTALDQPDMVIGDDTPIVTERFRLMTLHSGNGRGVAVGCEGGDDPTAATDETLAYERVTAAWSDVLGVAAFGPDDDFFRIGGQSLRAVRVMRTLSRDFDVRLPVGLLLANRTPRRLAAAVVSRLTQQAGS